MSRKEHAPFIEGEKLGTLVWHIPHLTPDNALPPLAQIYGMHNLVKFPKLQPH